MPRCWEHGGVSVDDAEGDPGGADACHAAGSRSTLSPTARGVFLEVPPPTRAAVASVREVAGQDLPVAGGDRKRSLADLVEPGVDVLPPARGG